MQNLDNRLQVRTPQYVRDWWEEVHAATYPEHRLTFPQWIRAIITKHCEEATGKPLEEQQPS